MAIDTSKNPGEQMTKPTGPVLERPDHEADEDLDLTDDDFEELS